MNKPPNLFKLAGADQWLANGWSMVEQWLANG